MIGYVTIGTNDSEKAEKFYDSVLATIGYERKMTDGGWIGYGAKGSATNDIYVCPPFDGKPAREGNGMMIAFKVKTQDEVRAAHAIALKMGGADEGAPGPRPADSKDYYGCYFRDPTGNKICVYWKPA